MTNLQKIKQKQKSCKHNGGKCYWNILPGAKCLKCGKELSEAFLKELKK